MRAESSMDIVFFVAEHVAETASVKELDPYLFLEFHLPSP